MPLRDQRLSSPLMLVPHSSLSARPSPSPLLPLSSSQKTHTTLYTVSESSPEQRVHPLSIYLPLHVVASESEKHLCVYFCFHAAYSRLLTSIYLSSRHLLMNIGHLQAPPHSSHIRVNRTLQTQSHHSQFSHMPQRVVSPHSLMPQR